MTTARVRFATADDLTDVLEIEDVFRQAGVSAWALMSEDAFEAKIGANSMLVAELEGNIIGYLMFTLMWGYPWIEYIRLLEQHRGRGIGSETLRHLEEYLRARGYSMLFSSITGGEDLPMRWHRQNGFSECGRIRWVWDGPDEVVVLKELATRD